MAMPVATPLHHGYKAGSWQFVCAPPVGPNAAGQAKLL
jgi:hypothetical protein